MTDLWLQGVGSQCLTAKLGVRVSDDHVSRSVPPNLTVNMAYASPSVSLESYLYL